MCRQLARDLEEIPVEKKKLRGLLGSRESKRELEFVMVKLLVITAKQMIALEETHKERVEGLAEGSYLPEGLRDEVMEEMRLCGVGVRCAWGRGRWRGVGVAGGILRQLGLRGEGWDLMEERDWEGVRGWEETGLRGYLRHLAGKEAPRVHRVPKSVVGLECMDELLQELGKIGLTGGDGEREQEEGRKVVKRVGREAGLQGEEGWNWLLQ